MNTTEKEKAQRFIIQNIGGIESAIKMMVADKDTYRKEVKRLTLEGGEYSVDFKEKQLKDLKNQIIIRQAAANKDISRRLEELRTLLQERDSVLDLNNPALSAALLLIQSLGKGITFEQAAKINANFLHDQSALQALRISYGDNLGNIDKLIYDSNAMVDYLKQLAYDALIREGSINFFSAELFKLATLEGITIEATPDKIGANDAMRLAAGLPVA